MGGIARGYDGTDLLERGVLTSAEGSPWKENANGKPVEGGTREERREWGDDIILWRRKAREGLVILLWRRRATRGQEDAHWETVQQELLLSGKCLKV